MVPICKLYAEVSGRTWFMADHQFNDGAKVPRIGKMPGRVGVVEFARQANSPPVQGMKPSAEGLRNQLIRKIGVGISRPELCSRLNFPGRERFTSPVRLSWSAASGEELPLDSARKTVSSCHFTG